MSTLSAECSSCEKSACGAIEYQFDGIGTDLTTLCTKVDGSASDGPKKGTARSQLCSDLVACARRTDCAKDGYLGCLCGDMKFAECYDYASSHGGAIMLPGVCRAEFLAASETTSWSRIAELNGLLGSTLEGQPGDAFKGYAALFDCSRQYCFDDCYQHVCPSAANQTKCGPEASDSCMSGKCVAGIPPTKFCAESQYGATCGTSVPGMRACQNRVCVELASSCATQTDGAVCSLAEGTGVCANKTCTPLLEACFEGDNGKACKPIVAGTSRPGVCVSTTVTGDLGPTTSYECALPSCSPSDLTSHCSP